MISNLREHWKRSLSKAITYRAVIIALDFGVILFFTKRTEVALGFVIVSNIYTTIAYYLHERFWNKVPWGKDKI